MSALIAKLERWIALLRQMAQNSRETGALTSAEAPDERDGWEQNARDLEAIANHLEDSVSTPRHG
jgi:hypothetical protein